MILLPQALGLLRLRLLLALQQPEHAAFVSETDLKKVLLDAGLRDPRSGGRR